MKFLFLVGGCVVVALLAGWWLSGLQFGGNTAISLLAWARSESWGISDPLFGHDLSSYIFGLPIYRRMLEYLLIVLVWSIMLIAIGLPQVRPVSCGHLLVASMPIFDPSPATGLAKSR